MKTFYLCSFLLLHSLTVFSQNLQFSSPCDTTFEYCINGNSCGSFLTTISASASSDDGCNQGSNAISFTYTLRIDNNGNVTEENGQGNELVRALPLGNHQIVFRALDNCVGETDSCTMTLSVIDCKSPTAYCLPGINTIPMPIVSSEEIEIWASDFDLSSFDNCTLDDNLTFAFSDDPNDQTIVRTCDDVTGLAENLTIYVFDEAGNSSTCIVGLLLQDCGINQPACFLAETICGDDVPKFSVIMNCNQDTTSVETLNGCPEIPDAPCNNLTFYKNDHWLNGVSTYDILLIQKHILGMNLLDSPYKIISADVNKSGSINAYDIVDLRKLILYRQSSIPGNTSWRFVPDDYVFLNASNPLNEQFPETFVLNSFPGVTTKLIAMKTGDVNCSAHPSLVNGGGQASEDRGQGGKLNLTYENQYVNAGEILELPLKTEAFSALIGFQFSLAYDETSLELLDWKNGEALPSLGAGNFAPSNGYIRGSWNVAEGQSVADGSSIVRLKFKVRKSGRLSDWIRLESKDLTAEAYVENYEKIEVAGVQLLAREKVMTNKTNIELYQNTPNPFTAQTTIGFYLPETTRASVTVYDLTGRVVASLANGRFSKGYHQLPLHASLLQTEGLYFYELKTSKQKLNRKLMLMH